ncbi:hypothetical protein I3843_10G083000 [Carya illinoinensis]|nr:hypothetical protein I3843_10G083000 [Carya illinoinensis]
MRMKLFKNAKLLMAALSISNALFLSSVTHIFYFQNVLSVNILQEKCIIDG